MATNGIRQETVNTFKDGMIMDYNPLIVPNTAYTHALNATYITMNGNEHIIQNDMGNGRVETAYLPEGYIPLGTTEFGGIIYIVSYNPLTDRCQIGSFPSPERNVTSDELGESEKTLNTSVFYESYGAQNAYEDIITACTYKLTLTDSALNPGDKFVVYETTGRLSDCNYISAKTQDLDLSDADLYPKYLKLSIVAIQDNGTVTSLNDALTWYEYDSNNYGYYIYPDASDVESDGTLVLDEYRNLVSSNYSVFTCKVSGKLAILAELETIDTFSVSWDAIKQSVSDDSSNSESKWVFYFYTNWSYENDNFNSKDKINLYGIKVEEYSCDDDCNAYDTATGDARYIIIDNYPKKANGVTYIYKNNDSNESTDDDTNDALTNLRTKFYAPDYISSLDALTDDDGNTVENIYYDNSNNTTRANDGNDNQFLIQTGYVLQQEAENGKYGYVQLVVSPMMPFGTLDYLKQSFTINVDKLGSGDIDLKGYKYYWEEENIALNWSLECYPERNKSVKSVTFNFYEYNENVKAWIENENNTQYIDDYALWYDVNEDTYALLENANDEAEEITDNVTMTPYSGDPDATFVKDNLSSYSGNFSYPISQSTIGLNNGSLYLVEIIVNYNDEKYIYYYRFMYTSNIFNNQYYKVDDYKDLVLNDYLTDDNVISITGTNVQQKLTQDAEYMELSDPNNYIESGTNQSITDNNSNVSITDNDSSHTWSYEATDQPQYFYEEKTPDVESLYQIRYTASWVYFDTLAENNIFDVTIKAIGKTVSSSDDGSYTSESFNSDDITTEVDVSDAQYTEVKRETTSSTDNEAKLYYHYGTSEITLDTDGGSLLFNFALDNFMYIDYTYSTILEVPYQLSHLDVGYYYYQIQARYNASHLFFYRGTAEEKDGDEDTDDVMDDVQSFISRSNFYSGLKEALEDYDVVVIALRAKTTKDKDCLVYATTTYNSKEWQSYCRFPEKEWIDQFVVMYAIKLNGDETPQLFMFSDNHNLGSNSTNTEYVTTNGWYDKGSYAKSYSGSGHTTSYDSAGDPYLCPLLLEWEDDDTRDSWGSQKNNENPFRHYYKLTDYNSDFTVYMYDIISYFDSYTWYINYSIDYQAAISLSINNTEISASDSDLSTMPNNLSYYWLYDSKEHDSSFTMTVTESESMEDLITDMIKQNTNYLYIPGEDDEDEGIVLAKDEEELSNKKIYNINGDIVTYLKRFTGSADKDKELIVDYPQDITDSYDVYLQYSDGLTFKSYSDKKYMAELRVGAHDKDSEKAGIDSVYVPRIIG